MAKRPHINLYSIKCPTLLLVFVFVYFHSFSQNVNNNDSLKLKKKPAAFTCLFIVDTNLNKVYRLLPKPRHLKTPTPLLQDSDGDGVPDQLDLEPNTPPGVAVDTHGRVMDTDGDGVPDYKDKEKLTPQRCFPVDSNGVGFCPEPACCREYGFRWPVKEVPDSSECNNTLLGNISFTAGSAKLNKTAIGFLDSMLTQINRHSNCKLKVKSYINEGTYRGQQLSWDRVYTVIDYIKQKGISEDRFIFYYSDEASLNVAELYLTVEDGPTIVPAPFSIYSTIKNVRERLPKIH